MTIKFILFTFILLLSSLSFTMEEKLLSDRPLIVIIDPGHGGNDQGTSVKTSSRLIKESDLTLSLSQKIIKIVREKYSEQIAVTVTRTQNSYIPLQKRISLSHNEKADFYLSLHYNSAFSTSISGTEIYFPENNKSQTNTDTILDSIKQDLIETGRIKQSLNFSHQLSQNWKTAKVNIRRAPFFVLEKADTPSILIEVGYLSNPTERKALLTENNQDLVAESIVKALIDFKETRDKQLN